MSQAITASSEFRAKERHDEAQALYNARKEIAQKLLEMNMPHDQIAKATDLTLEEISKL